MGKVLQKYPILGKPERELYRLKANKIYRMKNLQLFRLILVSFLAICQPVSAQQTKLSYQLAKLSNDEAQHSKVISILVKGYVNAIKEETIQSGGIFKYAAGNICSVNIPVWALKKLEKNNQIQRIEEGHIKVQTMNDKMLINNKVDLVHQGVSPLPQGYNGAGSIVGVIDTGLDFTHPDFKDSLGQSRVLWIWDHLLANGANTPQPYNYGQEFSKADIDEQHMVHM
jgi:subtilisin family serine protease